MRRGYFIVLQDQVSSITNPLESSIDEGPYLNIVEGRISAVSNDSETDVVSVRNESLDQNEKPEDSDTNNDDNNDDKVEEIGNKTAEHASTGARDDDHNSSGDSGGGIDIKKCLNQLTRCYRNKMWLLAYLAIGSSWPVLRWVYRLILKNKFRSINSGTRKRI